MESKTKTLVIEKSAQSYAFINALRGLAALLVAFSHFYQVTQTDYRESIWSQAIRPLIVDNFDIGKFAVGVFFLVSGFLIPYSLESTQSIPKFAIHRIFRLYPAYWISIIIFLSLNSWLAFEPQSSLKVIAANLTMLQSGFRQPDLIGVFWTLRIELFFYVLCAFLFWCGISRKINLIAYCCLAVATAVAVLDHFGFHGPTSLTIALSLMYCADALRRRSAHVYWLWLVTALSLAPIGLLELGDIGVIQTVSYWAAMAVFLLAYSFRQLTWFKHPIYTFLADISYSVYLVHNPVGLQVAERMANQGFPAIASFAMAYLSTVIVSWFIYKLIEKPAIKLGREITSHQKFKGFQVKLEPKIALFNKSRPSLSKSRQKP